jgi:hypothetical protein
MHDVMTTDELTCKRSLEKLGTKRDERDCPYLAGWLLPQD